MVDKARGIIGKRDPELLKELQVFEDGEVDGIYLNEEKTYADGDYVYATIEGASGTVYAKSFMNVKLSLVGYRQSELVCHFLDIIYHPHISLTDGRVCIHVDQKKPTNNNIINTLTCIQTFLIAPVQGSNGLNPEANNYFRNDKAKYNEIAKKYAEKFQKLRWLD
jgi:ubiquitin-protein ligase